MRAMRTQTERACMQGAACSRRRKAVARAHAPSTSIPMTPEHFPWFLLSRVLQTLAQTDLPPQPAYDGLQTRPAASTLLCFSVAYCSQPKKLRAPAPQDRETAKRFKASRTRYVRRARQHKQRNAAEKPKRPQKEKDGRPRQFDLDDAYDDANAHKDGARPLARLGSGGGEPLCGVIRRGGEVNTIGEAHGAAAELCRKLAQRSAQGWAASSKGDLVGVVKVTADTAAAVVVDAAGRRASLTTKAVATTRSAACVKICWTTPRNSTQLATAPGASPAAILQRNWSPAPAAAAPRSFVEGARTRKSAARAVSPRPTREERFYKDGPRKRQNDRPSTRWLGPSAIFLWTVL